jgi:hypothetical protein
MRKRNLAKRTGKKLRLSYRHIGWEISGSIVVETISGDTGNIEMKPSGLLYVLTKETLMYCVNDNGFGGLTIVFAELLVYKIFCSRYGHRIAMPHEIILDEDDCRKYQSLFKIGV